MILGPVHLLTQMDKWNYLQGLIIEKKIVSCFDIGKVPRSPGKLNWNWLSFLPFIFIFEQCEQANSLQRLAMATFICYLTYAIC